MVLGPFRERVRPESVAEPGAKRILDESEEPSRPNLGLDLQGYLEVHG